MVQKAFFILLIIILLCVDQLGLARRGGGGGGGRGHSTGRSAGSSGKSGGGGSSSTRGGSTARSGSSKGSSPSGGTSAGSSGGGTFGGGSSSSTRGSSTARTGSGGGGSTPVKPPIIFNTPSSGTSGTRGSSTARSGSPANPSRETSGNSGGGYGGDSSSPTRGSSTARTGSGGGGYTPAKPSVSIFNTPSFRSGTGPGSRSKSDRFTDMLIGAAAGHLIYKTGKFMLSSNHLSTPIILDGRPYYWDSSYYQQRAGFTTMCKLMITPSDPVFGNVYISSANNIPSAAVNRPKEVVWSCQANEECCGYECCSRYSGFGGYSYPRSQGYYYPPMGLGVMLLWIFLIVLLIFASVGCYGLYVAEIRNEI